MYIRYLLSVPLDWFMTILGMILAPVLPLFATHEAKLPRWLSWFDTYDNTLDGDDGWKYEHLLFLNCKGDSLDPVRIYLKRVCWLFRNTAYTFSRNVMGVEIEADNEVKFTGNPRVGNRPLSEGMCYATCKHRFMFYYVKKTFKGKCLRVYIGWKLKNKVDHPEWAGKAMLVFSVNPLMSYSEW